MSCAALALPSAAAAASVSINATPGSVIEGDAFKLTATASGLGDLSHHISIRPVPGSGGNSRTCLSSNSLVCSFTDYTGYSPDGNPPDRRYRVTVSRSQEVKAEATVDVVVEPRPVVVSLTANTATAAPGTPVALRATTTYPESNPYVIKIHRVSSAGQSDSAVTTCRTPGPCGSTIYGNSPGRTYYEARIELNGFVLARSNMLEITREVADDGPATEELLGGFGASYDWAPNLPRCYAGDPVNCATGNLVETFSDLSIGGRGVGLTFTRVYNSDRAGAANGSPFGRGWTFSFGESIDTRFAGIRKVTHADGSVATFTGSGPGLYSSRPWVRSELRQREDGSYEYTLPDHRVMSFSEQGRLEWVQDRNGNRTTLTYADDRLLTIADAGGRFIAFEHDAHGRIVQARDSAGHAVDYAYEHGRLRVTDAEGGVTRFEFDGPASKLSSVTDPRGNTVQTFYDQVGRVVRQVDASGGEITWDWGGVLWMWGQPVPTNPGMVVIEDAAGRRATHSFLGGLPVAVSKGDGAESSTRSFEYDINKNVTEVTDPNGEQWTATYDADGNRTSLTDPLDRTTEWEYDTDRNVTAVTSPSGRRVEMAYDANGNLETVEREHTESDQTQRTEFGYDTHGLLTSVTDPLNRTTTFAYNAHGDRVATTTPEGHTASAAYDAAGRQTSITTARGHAPGADPADFTTTFTRDAFGNPTDITDPLGRHTLLDYDANQNLVSLTDRDGRETLVRYDPANRPVEVERPDGTILETEYDPTGRVSAQLDGLDRATTFAYDHQGRLKSKTDPLNRTTSYGYDPAGNLTTVVDAANRTTTNSYDDAGQLTGISYSTGTPGSVSFSYTPDGERDTVSDDSGTSDYDYDSLGRLVGHSSGAGQQTGYGYDLADQLTEIAYPDALTVFDSSTGTPQQPVSTGTVQRDYDDDGNLVSVTDWLTNETTFDYNPDGLLTAIMRPNGTGASYEHDANGALTELTDAGDTTGLGRTHEALLSSSTPPVGSPTSYGYDDAQRLTSAGTATFGYDDADNLIELTVAGQTVTQAFDAANQLTATTAGGAPLATFAYDQLGERTSRTSATNVVTDYDYDQAGQLTRYHGPDHTGPGSVTETYSYDADGLRQTKTTGNIRRNHAYDLASSSLPLLITDGPTSYITGPDGLPLEQITQNGTVRYYHHDQLGSVTELTDQAGATVATYAYDAYGNPTGTPPTVENPFGYAGQYTDHATGLQYLRARYYDPATGQFLTRDPLETTTGQPYAYANNNPTNYTDPSGLFGLSDIGSFASNAAASFLDEASFGYSTKLAGSVFGFDAQCAEWGAGGGTGMALGMALGAGKFKAASKFVAKGDDFVDLATAQRRRHILDGDATGGGHRPGTGFPGKTEFPRGWSDNRIMHEISDVATDPASAVSKGPRGRQIVEGMRDGVNIRVILGSDGNIVTGYPTNLPRNPR